MTNFSKYVLFLWTLMTVCSCEGINEMAGLQDDNIGEEIIEILIHQETGLNLDLTPSTPENLT